MFASFCLDAWVVKLTRSLLHAHTQRRVLFTVAPVVLIIHVSDARSAAHSLALAVQNERGGGALSLRTVPRNAPSNK